MTKENVVYNVGFLFRSLLQQLIIIDDEPMNAITDSEC